MSELATMVKVIGVIPPLPSGVSLAGFATTVPEGGVRSRTKDLLLTVMALKAMP